jgi:hypothetical protein
MKFLILLGEHNQSFNNLLLQLESGTFLLNFQQLDCYLVKG